MDLLVEAEAVANALAWIGGAGPAPLTQQLERRASAVSDQAVAPWPDDDLGPMRARERPRLKVVKGGRDAHTS